MVVPFSDFQKASQGAYIQFPTTRLHDIARALGMQGSFEMQTLPREWSEYLFRASSNVGGNHSFGPGAIGGAGGLANTGRYGGGAPMSPLGQGNANLHGMGAIRPQGDPKNRAKGWKAKHKDRYGGQANNPKVHKKIKELMAGLEDVPFEKIEDACRKSHYKLRQCEQYEEGICPAYAAGKCTFARCQARHLFGHETPSTWVDNYCETITPGLKRIRDGDDIQPRKRRRFYEKQGEGQ